MQARYSQQLRLLADRVQPSHLSLPVALCDAGLGLLHHEHSISDGQAVQAALPYAAAISRLQQLSQAATPRHMLGCLTDTCRLVAEAVMHAGAPPPTADELMPLIAYVLLRARVGTLPVELAMLQEVAGDEELLGAQGYCLATFQVACAWVAQLRWDKLLHAEPKGASRRRRNDSDGREGWLSSQSAGGGRRERERGSSDGGMKRRSGDGGGVGASRALRGNVGTHLRSGSPWVGGVRESASEDSTDSRQASSASATANSTSSEAASAAVASPLAHPAIARSMELLRRLEGELAAGKRVSAHGIIANEAARPSVDPSLPSVGAEGLEGRSLHELLGVARAAEVDASGCVEKADLLQLLSQLHLPPLPSDSSMADAELAMGSSLCTRAANSVKNAPPAASAAAASGSGARMVRPASTGASQVPQQQPPQTRSLPRMGSAQEGKRERLREGAVLRSRPCTETAPSLGSTVRLQI